MLNVQICTPCPHAGCDAMATLRPVVDDATKKVTGYELVCEHGHETPWPPGAITNGKTCLSVYGRLLCKEGRGKDLPSIENYLRTEADTSRLAADPPMRSYDEMIEQKRDLPDTVVIRADAACRFGAVNYIITECQKQGYRKFSLRTAAKESN